MSCSTFQDLHTLLRFEVYIRYAAKIYSIITNNYIYIPYISIYDYIYYIYTLCVCMFIRVCIYVQTHALCNYLV